MGTADQHELHSAFIEEVTDWDEANPDHLSHPLTLRWFRDAMRRANDRAEHEQNSEAA